jgi:hypothetical protein
MKDITALLNENNAKREEYVVSFIDCKDEDGIPITVTITVDKSDIKAFEKFLKQEEDFIFLHAEGGSVEY